MTIKQLFQERARRFSEGKCPVCEHPGPFKRTGTHQEGDTRLRTMQCPHCGSAFRVRVQIDVFFCKVTREGCA